MFFDGLKKLNKEDYGIDKYLPRTTHNYYIPIDLVAPHNYCISIDLVPRIWLGLP